MRGIWGTREGRRTWTRHLERSPIRISVSDCNTFCESVEASSKSLSAYHQFHQINQHVLHSPLYPFHFPHSHTFPFPLYQNKDTSGVPKHFLLLQIELTLLAVMSLSSSILRYPMPTLILAQSALFFSTIDLLVILLPRV